MASINPELHGNSSNVLSGPNILMRIPLNGTQKCPLLCQSRLASVKGGSMTAPPMPLAPSRDLYGFGTWAMAASEDKGVTAIINPNGKRSQWRGFVGIFLTLLTALLFSLVTVLIKYLSNYDPLCLAVYRYAGVIVPVVPIIIYYECRGARIFGTIWPLNDGKKLKQFCWLSLCGLVGCASVLFQLSSLAFITVGDSSAISYASPTVVVILAHFILKEKCGFVSIATTLMTALGVFVITRPPAFTGAASFDPNTLMGTGLAAAGMLATAGSFILMRELRQVHFTLLNLTFIFWGVTEALTASLVTGTMRLPTCLRDTLMIVLVLPALTFLGQTTLALALKFEKAGPVAVVRTTDVLFSFLFQFLFLGVVPNVFSAAGASIIVLAVVICGLRRIISELPEDDARRKRFSYLLM